MGGDSLKEKASEFSKLLGNPNFRCSNGWLDRFKKRHGITFKKVCGEGGSVSEKVCEEWREILKDLIKDYHPDNIFNADESGLFFKSLPESTLFFKNERCEGGKKSKERITLLFAANMSGKN